MKSAVIILFCLVQVVNGAVLPERKVCRNNGHEIAIGKVYIDQSSGICRTYYCIDGNPPDLHYVKGSLKCSDGGMCYEVNTEIRKKKCETLKCSQEFNGWESFPGCELGGTCFHDRESVMKFDGTSCTCRRGVLTCQ